MVDVFTNLLMVLIRYSQIIFVLVGVLIASWALFVAMIVAKIDDRDDLSRVSRDHGSSPRVVTASAPDNQSMSHVSTKEQSFSAVPAQENAIAQEMTEQDAPPSDEDQAGSVPESHLEYWAKYGQDAYNDASRDLLVNESNQPQEESAPGRP